MIDNQYTQYGGVENFWLDTHRPLLINLNGLSEEYHATFVNVAREVIAFVNLFFKTQFYYGGISNFDPKEWSSFDFIGVCVNPIDNPARLASALLVPDWEQSCWKGGMITMFPKAFKPTYNFFDWLLDRRKVDVRESVFNVFLHEFLHILGVDHTNITPSLMVGDKVIEYGFGLQAWDLAVGTKYMKYKKGSNPDSLKVITNAHITNRGRYLVIPAILYRKKMYSVSMMKESSATNAWKPIYWKRWDKAKFDNTQDFSFSEIYNMSNLDESVVLRNVYKSPIHADDAPFDIKLVRKNDLWVEV